MAKIYVSSTFKDLEECRKAVIHLLRRMRHEVVAMEEYTAEDQWPGDKCLADVAACDLYVGLFAWRYGFIPTDHNPEQFSITEMEYRQAIAKKKHCLIFLLKEDALWPRPLMDRNPDRIEDFRARLSTTHVCDFFTSAQDAAGIVSTAVANWVREQGMGSFAGNIAFNLDAYFQATSKFYQRLELEGLTQPQREQHLLMQLSNIFVEPSVRQDRPPIELTKEAWDRLRREREVHDEDLPTREFGLPREELRRTREVYFEKPKRPVLEVVTDPRYRHAIVLGDPGSGKSTLARYVMLSLIGPPYVLEADDRLRQAFPDHLPLLVELRSFASLRAEGRCLTFLEFLDYLGKTEGRGLDKDALEEYLKNDGRAVVIFDGLDEIFDPADRETVARQIVGFAGRYPKVRILATSRIVGFPQKVMENGGFTVFTLQDLDEKQVEQFVGQWYALALSDRPAEAVERRQRILRSFAESASIRQLAGNPMLLTIMALIGKHQELPRERWKLYDHAASVLIEHWDINKHLRDHRLLNHGDFLGEDEKKELLRRLAHRMQSGDGGLAGNFIHKTELEAEFEQYLKDRFGKPPADATAIARLLIQQFRDRNFILCFRGAGSFGFVHRAFLEFFCASSLVFQFEKTQELSLDDLKEVFAAHWDAREWREPLRLICGMINEKFAGDVIDSLLDAPRRPREFEYDRLPPWHVALAVQCLSELNSLDQITDTAERVLRAACDLFDATRRLTIPAADWNGYLGQSPEAFSEFLKNEVASAAENVGANWPKCNWFVEWLRGYISFNSLWAFDEAFGTFVGSVSAGGEAAYRTISDHIAKHDGQTRRLMVLILATGWKNSKLAGVLLRDRAVNDPDNDARRDALSALATNFREAEGTLELLRERAVNDESPLAEGDDFSWQDYPRKLAIENIAQYWPQHPDTLPLLRERAQNDKTPWLRQRAQELAEELEKKIGSGG